MTALRRAFLAVVPPPAVLRWTESVVDSARRIDDGLRWTRPDQRHVTLQFLGRVDATEFDAIADSVAESVRLCSSFTLSLGGAGAFPDPRHASVLWLGVRQGSEALGELADAVAEPDDRPFRAHLTLARVSKARDVRAVVAALDAHDDSPAWTVAEVILFDSDTRPEGAVHTEHARFPLDGSR
jgi:2'-5' RNA ligase